MFLPTSPSRSHRGGPIAAIAPGGVMPRTFVYALANNKGLYQSAPTTNATTAATRTAQRFIFGIHLASFTGYGSWPLTEGPLSGSFCLISTEFPSLSLNQPVSAPPPVALLRPAFIPA